MTVGDRTSKICLPVVYIVDDDPDVCRMLCAILEHAGYRCEAFTSAQEFLDAIDVNVCGCLLLDICMPEMSGPQLQLALSELGCTLPIVFLSANADVPTAVQVLQRGAVNLIEKKHGDEVLLQAVRDAIAIDASQRSGLLALNDLRRRASELTPREREVAELLAEGKSNRQIAIALDLSERTIEIHRARVMAKLDCDSIVSFGVQWLKLQSGSKAVAQQQRGAAQ